MPFSRKLFSSSTDDEGKLSPKWSRSPRSPKVVKSPRSLKHPRSPVSPRPLTFTERNNDYLDQCLGCNEVEDLITWNFEQQKNGEATRPQTLLHHSFHELDECANRCQICRVFRQALLLEEVTHKGVLDIIRNSKGKVIVRWQDKNDKDGKLGASLEVVIENGLRRAGVVHLNNRNEGAHLALYPDPRNPGVIDQARDWLKTCCDSHVGDCDNLKFSNETPQLLIEILSPSLIQLRSNQAGEYVALSYCWGAETEEVKRGKTVDDNIRDRCRKPFSTKGFPATVLDTLYIVYAMGIRYAWIDSLCINQDSFAGGDKMHVVYSNALFTLCACATTEASAKLLDQREAWTQKTEPCRLGGQWLTTFDMSLNELRLRSPLAKRAWTLQEERLSPRMLYMSSNRIYWSCAKAHEIELKPMYEEKVSKLRRPMYSAADRDSLMPLSQDFLVACRAGGDGLYKFWADIVKSYASRDMTKTKDRLTALSGLAEKYLSANGPDKYLAGIWSKNLPEGLAWKVEKAVSNDRISTDPEAPNWPSWSWAVLPVQTAIETEAKVARSTIFKQISEERARTSGGGVDTVNTINHGEKVKKLCVTSRVRALWEPSSLCVKWSSISKTIDGEERFTFAINPEQNMHAIDAASGRVLVYEGRKKEVVAQLDFEQDVKRLETGQTSLAALEIGETTMLLLEKKGDGTYRRVGAAWDVRKNFFAFVEDPELLILQ